MLCTPCSNYALYTLGLQFDLYCEMTYGQIDPFIKCTAQFVKFVYAELSACKHQVRESSDPLVLVAEESIQSWGGKKSIQVGYSCSFASGIESGVPFAILSVTANNTAIFLITASMTETKQA